MGHAGSALTPAKRFRSPHFSVSQRVFYSMDFVRWRGRQAQGGQRKGSQSLLFLLSCCVQAGAKPRWPVTLLGQPVPGLPTTGVSWQSGCYAVSVSLNTYCKIDQPEKEKLHEYAPRLLFRTFKSAVEGRSYPLVALFRVGISSKAALSPSGHCSYLQ